MVDIRGGKAQGGHFRDNGGSVNITDGWARMGRGGNMNFTSGCRDAISSGNFDIATSYSGKKGVSGWMHIKTGNATDGDSVAITMKTGKSQGCGGGDIVLSVGDGDTASGDVTIQAGFLTTTATTGGFVSISTGICTKISSDPTMTLSSPNVGKVDVSGYVAVSTGTSSVGSSGSFTVNTGSAKG
jgi:hypothetical protein